VFSITAIPALGPTEPSIQFILGAVSPWYSDRGVKMTTHIHLKSRLSVAELYLHSPIRFHGLVPNYFRADITFLFIFMHINNNRRVYSYYEKCENAQVGTNNKHLRFNNLI
jgi:hypothetical protein